MAAALQLTYPKRMRILCCSRRRILSSLLHLALITLRIQMPGRRPFILTFVRVSHISLSSGGARAPWKPAPGPYDDSMEIEPAPEKKSDFVTAMTKLSEDDAKNG